MVPDAAELEAVMHYHERTKHHFNRFARGPGELDWANQPDPFRRYAGAVLTRLPVLGPDEEPVSPAYESLYARGADLHARGAVPESVERQSASHRGLCADRRDCRAWRIAGPVPLRAPRARPRAARRLPG